MELNIQALACILLVHYFTHTLTCPCCNIPCILLCYTSHARMLTLRCPFYNIPCIFAILHFTRTHGHTHVYHTHPALYSFSPTPFVCRHLTPSSSIRSPQVIWWTRLLLSRTITLEQSTYSLRHSPSILSFEFALKTHLFSSGL